MNDTESHKTALSLLSEQMPAMTQDCQQTQRVWKKICFEILPLYWRVDVIEGVVNPFSQNFSFRSDSMSCYLLGITISHRE